MTFLRKGIYLIIFCLPLYLIKIVIFKVPTTVLELLIYALFLFWLTQKGYKGLWGVVKHERLLVWGVLFLLAGISIATVFSRDLRMSAGIWKAWFIDPILFFVVFVTVIRQEDIKNVFKCIIFSGFVVAAISLVYLICGDLNYQGRLQGIFNSPNYLAMYLAIPLLLSFRFALRGLLGGAKGTTKGIKGVAMGIYGAISLIIIIALFYTQSFGVLSGILGVISLGLIVYLYQKNKKTLALILIVVGFALGLIIGLWKISSTEGLKSFDARFVIWDKAIEAFKYNAFVGIGPGTFEMYFPPYPKWGVPQPHNIFLAFLIQAGIIGFVGFILILIWFYKNSARNLALFCLMTYILVHGLTDTTYWKNDLSVMFWILIGITTVLQFYRIKQSVSFIDKE